jgi:streptogramin lyase
MNPFRFLTRRRALPLRPQPPKCRLAAEALEDRYLLSGFSYFDLRPQDRGVEDIETGPDGNMWFTEFDNDAIGRITPDGRGQSDSYMPRGSVPNWLATGPDGNVWFTEYGSNKIGQMSPGGLLLNEYPLPPGDSQPNIITAGPDGNLWFTEDGFSDGGGKKVGSITPTGTIRTCLIPSFGRGITAGSDGNVWFNMAEDAEVGRVNLSSSTRCDITYFPIPTEGFSAGMTTGPDGNIWSTTNIDKSVLRINVNTGAVLETVDVNSAPADVGDISTGPDGKLYVGAFAGVDGVRSFYSITPDANYHSVVSEIPLPEDHTNYFKVTPGTDGNIWLYDLGNNQIGRYNLGSNPASSGRPSASALATTMAKLPGTTTGTLALAEQVPVGRTPLSQTSNWQGVDSVFSTAEIDQPMSAAFPANGSGSAWQSAFIPNDLGAIPVLGDPLAA